MTLGAMCCITTPSYYWVVWQSCSEFGQRLPLLYPISLNSKIIMDYDLGNMALTSLEPRECSTSFEETYYIHKLGERTGHWVHSKTEQLIPYIIQYYYQSVLSIQCWYTNQNFMDG